MVSGWLERYHVRALVQFFLLPLPFCFVLFCFFCCFFFITFETSDLSTNFCLYLSIKIVLCFTYMHLSGSLNCVLSCITLTLFDRLYLFYLIKPLSTQNGLAPENHMATNIANCPHYLVLGLEFETCDAHDFVHNRFQHRKKIYGNRSARTMFVDPPSSAVISNVPG